MRTELVNILLEAGIIDEKAARHAEDHALGSALVERLLDLGYGCENDVYKVIKNKLKLAVVTADEIMNVSPDVIKLIPKEMIERHHFLPFHADSANIHIAVFDPTQDVCLNEICFFTPLRIIPYGALASDLTKALNKHFGLQLSEQFKHKKVANTAEQKKENLPPRPNMPLPGQKNTKIDPVDLTLIQTATTKDEIIDRTIQVLQPLAHSGLIFFVKNDDMIAVKGFGEHIEKNIEDYKVSLSAPNMFHWVFENKKEYIGKQQGIPVVVVPALIEDEVFACIYCEKPLSIDEIKKTTAAMAKSFDDLLNSY